MLYNSNVSFVSYILFRLPMFALLGRRLFKAIMTHLFLFQSLNRHDVNVFVLHHVYFTRPGNDWETLS